MPVHHFPNSATIAVRFTAALLVCLAAGGCGQQTTTPVTTPAAESKPNDDTVGATSAATNGLLGHWKFDGNCSDSTAHGHHGKPLGKPEFGEGKVGRAIQLDGASQCVEVPALATDVTQFTLASWMYVDAMPSPQSFAAIYHNNGWEDGDVHLPFKTVDGTMDLGIKGNKPSMSVPSFNVQDMQRRWVHLAVTYDADDTKQVRFYVDGELTDTFDIDAAHPVRLGPGRIGGWDAQERWFQGRLDDMYLYERVLSAEEVAALAAQDKEA